MEKQRPGKKRTYSERLLPEERRRYHQKILESDGNDPYDIPTRCWSANPDDLPELSYINIVNYFVLGKNCRTRRVHVAEVKAYKRLDSYRLFVSGWVRDVKRYSPDGCQNSVISAKVLHSQRLNEPALSPWTIATFDGNILSAHCTCMAGVGETCMAGVGETCTHVPSPSRSQLLSVCDRPPFLFGI
ncbi:uncharacterized protein [Littorina saxatilis]|uniref:uncharacterized protein n=1 Tax=Littorina saxatilis TaxID=31220 RepID=UPI0038B6ACF2